MIQNRDVLYGSLFHDVQMSGIFQDSKTFVDAIAKKPVEEILKDYERVKNEEGFNLVNFIHTYFDLPKSIASNFETNENHTPKEHVEHLWSVLTRSSEEQHLGSSLFPLPKGYIVPGGRFREIYYWDSYFTIIGLVLSGKIKMVQNMVDNFAHLIEEIGFIPNGNRSYFDSRSQPPFYALMISLLGQQGIDTEKYMSSLRAEYDFWMTGSRCVRINGYTVNRYWDNKPKPRQESYREDFLLGASLSKEESEKLFLNVRAACESGWDFSSRWLRGPMSLGTIDTTSFLPVDLNCLLYFVEQTLGMESEAKQRADWINNNCWNEAKGYYYDFDLESNKLSIINSLAGVFPLFMNIASDEQASMVAEFIKTHFLKPGGLITTDLVTGQQWDSPNGWAPLQWMTVIGLSNYGHTDLAKKIANRWTKLNEAVFRRTGKFVEKYNVTDLSLEAGGGEYPVQDGFGWTNGVYLGLKDWLEKN